MKTYDVCIIGGGAAGLAAAASLSKEIRVCILEKNKIPGKKLMATGGGRCNITNRACENSQTALEFFKLLGLETYSDAEGRYYPYSNQAADVVKILLAELQSRQVEIVTESAVIDVTHTDGRFLIRDAAENTTAAGAVLLAAGGKAAPQFGTTGDGYAMARSLGHEVTRVYPILTGIQCGDFRHIKGVRARGRVTLLKDSAVTAEEIGEIQFTEDGISGICVFNLTPYIKADAGEDFQRALERYRLELDLAPDFTQDALADRRSSFGILSDKLSAMVDLEKIKKWGLPVIGVKGWKHAQCTAGGVALHQIDMDTMESRLLPNLYFAGEIIDVQGPCGGYNLQNAWETGMKAAEAINGKYSDRKDGRQVRL